MADVSISCDVARDGSIVDWSWAGDRGIYRCDKFLLHGRCARLAIGLDGPTTSKEGSVGGWIMCSKELLVIDSLFFCYAWLKACGTWISVIIGREEVNDGFGVNPCSSSPLSHSLSVVISSSEWAYEKNELGNSNDILYERKNTRERSWIKLVFGIVR